jgi:hypothetical protein
MRLAIGYMYHNEEKPTPSLSQRMYKAPLEFVVAKVSRE